MKAVGRGAVVAIDLELADFHGNLIQASDRPVHYLHGYGELLPALERALEGKPVGARISARLEPEEAFGEYDETLLRVEPRHRFPEALEVGMRFEGVPGDPDSGETIYAVTDLAEDKVVLDGNHPLAGIGLEFRCTVRAVRAASAGEIERGAADDPDALALRPG